MGGFLLLFILNVYSMQRFVNCWMPLAIDFAALAKTYLS